MSCPDTVKTDLGVYPVGTPPTQPLKGATVCDPTFGSEIMRITDASDGTQCTNAYSYWPTFNCDNTRILALCDGNGIIFTFNPTTYTLGSQVTGATGTISYEYGFIWSHLDSNAAFGLGNLLPYIQKYNVSTNTWSTLRDLSSSFSGKYFVQMSLSVNDDIVAFTVKNQSDFSTWGYAVYQISTSTVLYSQQTSVTDPALDEVQIDKSGGYLVIKTGNSGAGVIETRILDLATLTFSDLTDNAPDYSPGHSDNGYGVVCGIEDWTPSITRRQLATPYTLTHILTPSSTYDALGHVSALATNEDWLLVSSYSAIISEVFNNEVYLVSTSGTGLSGQVRRFLHHYSAYQSGDYWTTPRANVSLDGTWVAYSSNWGDHAGRIDLHIAKIPPSAQYPPLVDATLSLNGTVSMQGVTLT